MLTPLRVLCQYGKHCGYISEQLCSVHIGRHANFAYPAIVLGSCSMFKLLVHVYLIKAGRETTTCRTVCSHLCEHIDSTGSTGIIFHNRKFYVLHMQSATPYLYSFVLLWSSFIYLFAFYCKPSGLHTQNLKLLNDYVPAVPAILPLLAVPAILLCSSL